MPVGQDTTPPTGGPGDHVDVCGEDDHLDDVPDVRGSRIDAAGKRVDDLAVLVPLLLIGSAALTGVDACFPCLRCRCRTLIF